MATEKTFEVTLADLRTAQERATTKKKAMAQAAEHNLQDVVDAVELDADGKPVVVDAPVASADADAAAAEEGGNS